MAIDLYISGGSARSKEFVLAAVQGRQPDAQAFVDASVDLLVKARIAGVPYNQRNEIARLLHDAIGDIVGEMQHDLDEEGIAPDLAGVKLEAFEAEMRKVA